MSFVNKQNQRFLYIKLFGTDFQNILQDFSLFQSKISENPQYFLKQLFNEQSDSPKQQLMEYWLQNKIEHIQKQNLSFIDSSSFLRCQIKALMKPNFLSTCVISKEQQSQRIAIIDQAVQTDFENKSAIQSKKLTQIFELQKPIKNVLLNKILNFSVQELQNLVFPVRKEKPNEKVQNAVHVLKTIVQKSKVEESIEFQLQKVEMQKLNEQKEEIEPIHENKRIPIKFEQIESKTESCDQTQIPIKQLAESKTKTLSTQSIPNGTLTSRSIQVQNERMSNLNIQLMMPHIFSIFELNQDQKLKSMMFNIKLTDQEIQKQINRLIKVTESGEDFRLLKSDQKYLFSSFIIQQEKSVYATQEQVQTYNTVNNALIAQQKQRIVSQQEFDQLYALFNIYPYILVGDEPFIIKQLFDLQRQTFQIQQTERTKILAIYEERIETSLGNIIIKADLLPFLSWQSSPKHFQLKEKVLLPICKFGIDFKIGTVLNQNDFVVTIDIDNEIIEVSCFLVYQIKQFQGKSPFQNVNIDSCAYCWLRILQNYKNGQTLQKAWEEEL